MHGHPHRPDLRQRRAHAGPDAVPDAVGAVRPVALDDLVQVPLDRSDCPSRMPDRDVVSGVVDVDEERRVAEAPQRVARLQVRAADPGELAAAISKVTAPIMMGVTYFLVMTPIGLLMRLFGRNPLRHRERNGGFWFKAGGRSDLEDQF